jgi:hypothetical protein
MLNLNNSFPYILYNKDKDGNSIYRLLMWRGINMQIDEEEEGYHIIIHNFFLKNMLC